MKSFLEICDNYNPPVESHLAL